jgi:acyl-CoA thioester hydrolase
VIAPAEGTWNGEPVAVRVRYPEVDGMGVAYHAHYLTWFELGRTELMRRAGWPYARLEQNDGLYFPVIEAQARYHAPARYDDELSVRTRVGRVGGARVRFDYRITHASTERLLASGFTVHAVVTRSGRPGRLPVRIRDGLRALRGES